MKKTKLILILFVLTQLSILSQDDISQITIKTMFGANVSFNYTGISDSKAEEYEITFRPNLGTIINSNSIFGVQAGISYKKTYLVDYYGSQYPPNEYYRFNEYTLFYLYFYYRYHNTIKGNFEYYVEPKLGTLFVKDSDTRTINPSFNVGLLYYITKKLSVEMQLAGLDYAVSWHKETPETLTHALSIQHDLITPNFGVKYYF